MNTTKILLFLLIQIFYISFAYSGIKESCTICCEPNYKNVVSNKSYEGFIINLNNKLIEDAGIYDIKIDSFWTPTIKDISNLEISILDQFSSFILKHIPSDLNYKYFRNYLRQYGGIYIENKKYILITFTEKLFLDNFCEKYYLDFKSKIIRMNFQKWGKDFIIIYDTKQKIFKTYKN